MVNSFGSPGRDSRFRPSAPLIWFPEQVDDLSYGAWYRGVSNRLTHSRREIARGTRPASVVWKDDLTLAFIDFRQFHAGHTLVIPRQHLRDVRELDDATAGALALVTRITRAVARAFPSQGLSLWHSNGEAADQEVPHLHFHVLPRLRDDRMLRIYPSAPALPDRLIRDSYAQTLRSHLN